RLLHPFMPFISEEIWQTLPHQGDSIMIKPYPTSNENWNAPEDEQQFTLLEQAVGLVRTARVLLNYPPGQHIKFAVTHDDLDRRKDLEDLRPYLAHLGRGSADLLAISDRSGSKHLRLVTEGLSVAIAVPGEIDLQKALDRIRKQQEEQEKEIARLEGK